MKHLALLALVIAFGVAPANTYAAKRARESRRQVHRLDALPRLQALPLLQALREDGGTCGVCRRRSSADAWREAAARNAEKQTIR